MRRDVLSFLALIPFHILHFAQKSTIKFNILIQTEQKISIFVHHISSVEFHGRYVFYRSRVSSDFLQNRKDLHGLISMVTSINDLNSCLRHRARRAARLRATPSGFQNLTGVRNFPPIRPDWLWGPPSLPFRVYRGFSRGATAGAVSRSFLTEVINDWSYTSTPRHAHKDWRGTSLRSTCKTHAPIVTKFVFWSYGLCLVGGYQSSGGAYCLQIRGIILKFQVRFLKLHGFNIHETETRIPKAPY